MVKTPDQLKNMIIDWCKEDGIDCQEVPKKEGLNFRFAIGKSKITVVMQEKFPDRITFVKNINFTDEHQKLINETWVKGKKTNMILTLQINAVTFNVRQGFMGTQDNLKGITQNLIQSTSSFEKIVFLDKAMRLEEIHIVTLNILSNTLGIEMNILKKQEEAKDADNPLTG